MLRSILVGALLTVGMAANSAVAQQGTLESFDLFSPALDGNLIGDPATRTIRIYLPPNYESSQRRYPVVHILHGFGLGSAYFGSSATKYDALINTGRMPECILVFVDGNCRFGGCQYLSSEAIGDYGGYITQDIVDYVDANYRTIPHRTSRGIYGHSMGGLGSMRLALVYPEAYDAVVSDAGSYDWGYETYRRAMVHGAIQAAINSDWDTLGDIFDFDPPRRDFLALAAGTIPNPDNPPYFVDVPFVEVDGIKREPNPGDWDRVWDRVIEHDVIHEVDRYIARPDQLGFIGFFHGRNDPGFDGGTVVDQARGLSNKLTEAGIGHTYIEHDGGHAPQIEDALGLLVPQLRTLPPEAPDVAAAPERIVTAAGQPFLLNALRIRLESSLERLEGSARLLMDASALGGDPAIPFENAGDAQYAGNGTLTPTRSGRFRLPILLDTEAGDVYVAHTVEFEVFPAEDLAIVGAQPLWNLEANRRVTPTPAAFAGRDALSLEGSGSWRVTLEPNESVDLFGYEALAFGFHPAAYSLREGRAAQLRAASQAGQIVDLLEFVDLERQEWQSVVVPIEAFGLDADVALQELRFTGTLEGTFYLADIRLMASEAPAAPTAVAESRQSSEPAAFALGQKNYPNPFNSGTVIPFALPEAGKVELIVYNLAGQQVASLAQGVRPAGQYRLHWDGRDQAGRALASGLYFYRLQTQDRIHTRKLLLLR